MRTIKFRVWDGNKFHYPECDLEKTNHYLQFGSNGVFFLHNSEGEYITGSKDNGVIQQFTGLKDKNGKEIYEGDIIIAIRSNEPSIIDLRPLSKISDDDTFAWRGKRTFLVDFDVRNLCWNYIICDKKVKGNPYHEIYLLSDIEIIGNIHENSELL